MLTDHSNLARNLRHHGYQLRHGVLLPLEYVTPHLGLSRLLMILQDTTRTTPIRLVENATLHANLYIAKPTDLQDNSLCRAFEASLASVVRLISSFWILMTIE